MRDYEEDNLHRSVGRIEGKLDAFLLWQTAHDKEHEEQANRIRALEDSRNRVIGASGVVSALAAVFMTYVTTKFT